MTFVYLIRLIFLILENLRRLLGFKPLFFFIRYQTQLSKTFEIRNVLIINSVIVLQNRHQRRITIFNRGDVMKTFKYS